jgi:hypothetical protein
MKKSTTTLRYHIQASLDGGAWHDLSINSGFKSLARAERQYDLILRECFPTWRGLSIAYRIVRRKVTISTDQEVKVFATPAHGEKRILLSEMFVPDWLPKRDKERLKMRRIPGAPEQYQPTSQLPISQQNSPIKES